MATAVISRAIQSQFQIEIIWSGCIGFIAGIIVAAILFCQLLNQYIKTFTARNQGEIRDKSKTPYILVMIYLFFVFMECIMCATVSTNILSGLNLEFTYSRCLFATICNQLSVITNYIILSVIFLHRIYLAFKDSVFDYKPWIYRSFFIFIIIAPLIFGISTYFTFVSTSSYTVHYDPYTNLAVCVLNDAERDKMARCITSLLVVIFQSLTGFALLFLFIRGLWLLNRQTMIYFLDKHGSGSQLSRSSIQMQPNITALTPESEKSNSNSPSAENVLQEWQRQKTITKEQMKPEVQRIITLHNLIKKHTILVCIATVSTVILWMGFAVNFLIMIEFGWSIIINSICIWFMLDTSETYWGICKRYGLCLCCYWRTNKLGL